MTKRLDVETSQEYYFTLLFTQKDFEQFVRVKMLGLMFKKMYKCAYLEHHSYGILYPTKMFKVSSHSSIFRTLKPTAALDI